MYEVSEVEDCETFYRCKEFPKIIVSRDGRFRNSVTLEPIVINCLPDFYPTITYPGEDTVLVHRILAFMFVEKPNDFEDKVYIVNHKDGNKRNYKLNNLEWVTPSRNAVHAYETGLRPDNTPILVKDLRDNSVKRFYSLQECARSFKVNGFRIHWYLRPKRRGKVSFNYYVIIREGDVWPEVDESSLGKHQNGMPKPVVVFDVENDSAIVYESVASAARAHGLSPAGLFKRMHRTSSGANDTFLFKYADDSDLKEAKEIVTNRQKTTPPTRQPVPITVKNLLTGETKEYGSTEVFARMLGVEKNTVQKGVLVNGGRWRNYFITYNRPTKE